MIITFSPPPQCSQCLKTLDSPRRLILETEKSFDKLHALKYKFYFKVLLCTICVTMHFSLCLLSWMKTRLKQAKWAQIAHETEPSWRLPDHPDGVGPSHHPSLHCPHCEDDSFYSVMFWPSWPMIFCCRGSDLRIHLHLSPLRGQNRSKSKKKIFPRAVTLLAW